MNRQTVSELVQAAVTGKADNHLLPFIWMHDGVGTEGVRNLVRAARQGNCREVCVESRPHENFCRDEWWRDMDAILDEAEKLGMRVWILDDKHFPTGFANGLIRDKYPERRKWQLFESGIDVVGPMKSAAIRIRPLSEENEESIVHICARRRTEDEGIVLGEGYEDLTGKVRNGILFWDIPEGVWRIFCIVKTRRFGNPDDIHMIDPESVSVQIEAVYEPHYQHYRKYFGNVIAGFFSDEPAFGNRMSDVYRYSSPGMYDLNIGTQGLALPWTDVLLGRMEEELGEDPLPLLPMLWFEGPRQEEVRVAYMNAVTRAWRDAFSYQLGNWCRERGVQYIGHIIEDMNCHAHLSYSGGHYFRSLEGQDMAGIDVVLHQIMPGISDCMHSGTSFGRGLDPAFFDYLLAKLAASAAHLEPMKQGRAMCEVFGAYGWAEGTPFMKVLMDHMLVRGINRFVPHAFSPAYPDPDCPPHFYGGGDNPQFPGFARLMDYTNFTASLLEGGKHIASAALLYNIEAEWADCRHQRTQVPAKVLYDAQRDFDVVSSDMLKKAGVENGHLVLNGLTFPVLVCPAAEWLPEELKAELNRLAGEGLQILFTGWKPEGCAGEVIGLKDLPEAVPADVTLSPAFPKLRVLHMDRGGNGVYMLVNEDFSAVFEGEILLPSRGRYAFLQKQLEVFRSGVTEDGRVKIRLAPFESCLLVFGAGEGLAPRESIRDAGAFTGEWDISRASHETLTVQTPDPFRDPGEVQSEAGAFVPVCRTAAGKPLPDMTGFEAPGDPGFSGIIRYETLLSGKAEGIDLGAVGHTARLLVNGKEVGLRYTPPYRFDLRGLLKEGTNRITVEVGNTLAHACRDGFSDYMQIPPSGITGPVRLIRYQPEP